MSVNIAPYLSFEGNCAEAFALYEKLLGGEITMKMTYGEAPMPSDPAFADKVMHICLRTGTHELMGSDVGPERRKPMSGMAIAIALPTPDEAHSVFEALAEGGHVGMAMTEVFWTKAFGTVVDRFGTPWYISAEATQA